MERASLLTHDTKCHNTRHIMGHYLEAHMLSECFVRLANFLISYAALRKLWPVDEAV